VARSWTRPGGPARCGLGRQRGQEGGGSHTRAAAGSPEVQVAPASDGPVVARHGLVAARAPELLRRSRSRTTTPTGANVTPVTWAPGIASIVLNAVVTRTFRPFQEGSVGCRTAEPTAGAARGRLSCEPWGWPDGREGAASGERSMARRAATGPTETRGVPRFGFSRFGGMEGVNAPVASPAWPCHNEVRRSTGARRRYQRVPRSGRMNGPRDVRGRRPGRYPHRAEGGSRSVS